MGPLTDVRHEIGDLQDPESRLATVRIENSRIEIVLLEPDSEWVQEKLDMIHGAGVVVVVGYRGQEDR